MTYCLAMSLDSGLVFASDSRTNAGVDYVTTYSKMHVFTPSPDRLFVVLSAGSLATTQEVLNRLRRDLEADDGRASLRTGAYLFEAAHYLGQVSHGVQEQHAAALAKAGFSGEVSLILGGQVRPHPPGIFLVYPQGNYITASPETPYLQIGENKYGKPALDRIIDRSLSLEDGARLALVSLDATRHSNITVGPPFEVGIYPRDSYALSHQLSLSLSDPYYEAIRKSWQEGLRETFRRLPRFDWEPPRL